MNSPVNVGPTITLATPNGGEIWAGGSAQSVTWSSSFVSTVDLQYRVAPNGAWVPIATGLAALPASYSWSLPYVPAASATVRVSGAGGTPSDTGSLCMEMRPSDWTMSQAVPLFGPPSGWNRRHTYA